MSSMPLYLSLLKFNEIVLNFGKTEILIINQMFVLLIYGMTVNEHNFMYGGTCSVG